MSTEWEKGPPSVRLPSLSIRSRTIVTWRGVKSTVWGLALLSLRDIEE